MKEESGKERVGPKLASIRWIQVRRVVRQKSQVGEKRVQIVIKLGDEENKVFQPASFLIPVSITCPYRSIGSICSCPTKLISSYLDSLLPSTYFD